MAKQAMSLAQLVVLDRGVTPAAQRIGHLTLLPGGEEDVAGHAHDQHGVVAQDGEAGDKVCRRGWAS